MKREFKLPIGTRWEVYNYTTEGVNIIDPKKRVLIGSSSRQKGTDADVNAEIIADAPLMLDLIAGFVECAERHYKEPHSQVWSGWFTAMQLLLDKHTKQTE